MDDKTGFLPSFVKASKEVMEENPHYAELLRDTIELLGSDLFGDELKASKTAEAIRERLPDIARVW